MNFKQRSDLCANPVVLWVLGLLCVFTVSAHAATYYVSNSGEDSNSGTAERSPWKTVAKVKAAPLQPGEHILFARGGEWHEQIAAPASGASGNPIVFDAYGNGAKPKFWGSDILPNKNWKAQGGNVYVYSGLDKLNVTVVLANHGTESNGQWFNAGNAASQEGAFEFSNGTLRIHSASNPITDGRVYTAVVREDVIASNNKDHLVFRNLAGDETSTPNMGYVIRVEGSQDVLVESCDAFRGGKHLVGVINSTGFVGKNLYAAYANPAAGSTFLVSYSGDESKYSNTTSQYINCKAEHFEKSDGGQQLFFVCHGGKLGPITFVNPTDLGGKFSFLQDNPAQTVSIKGGLIQDTSLELFASGVLVDGVTFAGNSAIDIWSNNNTIQNCVMSIKQIGGGPTGYRSAILTRNGANGKNNTIRFNTIVLDPGTPDIKCLYFGSSGQKNSWYGNILLSSFAVLCVDGGKLTADDASQCDYNFYNSNAAFGLGVHARDALNLTQWKALGFADAHSLNGDPQFDNPAARKYELRDTSPALDAAKLDAGLSKQIPSDFNGNPRL